MRPSERTVLHEAAHVAAARWFGFEPRVTFCDPYFDNGDLALTSLEGNGDRSPLARSIISYAPVFAIVGADWESDAFSGDREILEKVRPPLWHPEIWLFKVVEETRGLIVTERFRLALDTAYRELQSQAVSA